MLPSLPQVYKTRGLAEATGKNGAEGRCCPGCISFTRAAALLKASAKLVVLAGVEPAHGTNLVRLVYKTSGATITP